MSLKRGVLVESRGKHGVVLTPEGEFLRVRLANPSAQVGQEVDCWEVVDLRVPRLLAAVAAACLILGFGAWAFVRSFAARPGPVLAYVSLDINPSVQLGVDRRLTVREAEGLNQEGESLLLKAQVHGRNLRDALLTLVDAAVQDGYLRESGENAVLITTVPGEQDGVPVQILKDVRSIGDDIKRNLAAKHVDAVVESISGGQELKQKAKEMKVSPGRMAVALKALAEGIQVSEKQLREAPVTAMAGNAQRLQGLGLGNIQPLQLEELVKQFKANKLKLFKGPSQQESAPEKPDTSLNDAQQSKEQEKEKGQGHQGQTEGREKNQGRRK
ncbi:MAG: anti-sigma factor domain-containing protein [Bacillota bacterium]